MSKIHTNRSVTYLSTKENPKGFIVYSQTIDDVYEILEDYIIIVLIVVDDMITDMENYSKSKSYS